MTQQLLPETPEKTRQQIQGREASLDSGLSRQSGIQPIHQLQRTLGNRQVAQLIQAKRLTPEGQILGIQRKLTVGAADDQFEQEADHVARQVMSMSDAAVANSVQRTMSPEEDKDKMLQTKPLAGSIAPFVQREMMNNEEDKEEVVQAKSAESMSGSFEASGDVEAQLNQSKGRGSSLPDPVRAYMEPRFGVNFSHVRIHTGSDAIQMNRDVGAQAFTHGSDIYYGAGSGPSSLELTAHELTHVVQQTGHGSLWADSKKSKSKIEPIACLQRQTPAPASVPEASAPIESWGMKIEKGGEGKDQPRPMDYNHTTLFKGDKAIVTLKYSQSAQDNHGGIVAAISGNDVSLIPRGWKDNRAHMWEITFSRVGKVSANFEAGRPRQTYSEQFTVVADLQDFTLACGEAQSRILERFASAAERLNQAARAFRQAQAEQEADLKDVAAGEKMIDDLLWGAIFAAAGGFAGGAVGGWVKKVKDGALAKDDWLIDTAKDTAKFTVRSLDKIRGGTPSTAGDSTASGRDDPTVKHGGERSASGQNPMDFLTSLSEQVAGEGRKAHGKLAELISAARTARDANSKSDFEEDPVSVVNGGLDLANIESIETNKAKYLKGLWKTWLGTYAWKSEWGGGGGPASARDKMTSKIRKKIAKAAKECGEYPDDWIREFGLPAKQRAEEEAESANQNWEPPDYSWP